MRYRMKTGAVLLGFGALLVACLVSGDGWLIATAQAQPPKLSPTKRVDDVRTGRIIFQENCAACHQEGARGQAGLAPSLVSKEFLAAASDRFLKSTILDGRVDTNMMPFNEVLKESEIDAIIAYLRASGGASHRGSEVDEEWQARGDPRLGKHWFAQICAGCHGPNGEGYEGDVSGTAIGKKGFLAKASDGFIRYIIKYGRSNTAMRGFSGPDALADLSDAEIDDIISYLRILE